MWKLELQFNGILLFFKNNTKFHLKFYTLIKEQSSPSWFVHELLVAPFYFIFSEHDISSYNEDRDFKLGLKEAF